MFDGLLAVNLYLWFRWLRLGWIVYWVLSVYVLLYRCDLGGLFVDGCVVYVGTRSYFGCVCLVVDSGV